MSGWRVVFMIVFLVLGASANIGMLIDERIDAPATAVELVDTVRAPQYQYLPSRRRMNFLAMGLDESVEPAVAAAARLDKQSGRIEAVMQESRDEVAVLLCAGGMLPPRYAALALLLEQDGDGVRRVIFDGKGGRATSFFEQEWFVDSLTDDIFMEFERRQNAADDAAAMGVAAVIANAEAIALAGEDPWNRGIGGRWGLEEVFEDYGYVEAEVVKYFALMHVMTEIARNEKSGICR